MPRIKAPRLFPVAVAMLLVFVFSGGAVQRPNPSPTLDHDDLSQAGSSLSGVSQSSQQEPGQTWYFLHLDPGQNWKTTLTLTNLEGQEVRVSRSAEDQTVGF